MSVNRYASWKALAVQDQVDYRRRYDAAKAGQVHVTEIDAGRVQYREGLTAEQAMACDANGICTHEAAHAVLATFVGLPVDQVYAAGESGQVSFAGDISVETKERAALKIAVKLAGLAAEGKRGQSVYEYAINHANAKAAGLTTLPGDVASAGQIVRKHWQYADGDLLLALSRVKHALAELVLGDELVGRAVAFTSTVLRDKQRSWTGAGKAEMSGQEVAGSVRHAVLTLKGHHTVESECQRVRALVIDTVTAALAAA